MAVMTDRASNFCASEERDVQHDNNTKTQDDKLHAIASRERMIDNRHTRLLRLNGERCATPTENGNSPSSAMEDARANHVQAGPLNTSSDRLWHR